ncbi:MAG TPA: carboxypeptidase-like regulatory domain-containing protein, partial [Thermoanaerobaculia bacterium]
MRFSLAPGGKDRERIPREITVLCPVRESVWTCEVPAARLDLRIKGEGFIPLYLWGVAVEPAKTRDLGLLRLRRGASVAGWVQSETGEPLPPSVSVELEPESSGVPGSRGEYDRLRSLTLETRTNERGFFQFEGVKPGSYVVTASKEGFAPARRGSIVVREGLQAEILEPLQLAKPLELEVRLDPALDPFGHRWRLRLSQPDLPGELNEDLWNGTASAEGLWHLAGLAPGSYRLHVLGDSGTRWAAQEIQLEPGRTSVDIEIPLILVKGSVTLGDDPLSATLWFGGRSGSRRIRFQSDDDGRFEGFLPSEGVWPVDLASDEHDLRQTLDPVEVKVPEGKTYAAVKVRIPDTRLAGEVVDETGRKAPRALVSLYIKGNTQVYADEKGEFELRGVKPGPTAIEAEDGPRTTGPVEIVVEENRETPRVRLVLREVLTIRGRVFSSLGPTPGAQLNGFPAVDQVGYSSSFEVVTGPDGGFLLKLPVSTQRVNLLVFAPGFAMRMMSVAVERDRPLEIAVEPTGGTLVLELPADAEPPPLLAHAGAFTFPLFLQRWATLQGAVQVPGRLTLPNVEPGAYSLCVRAS